MEETARSGGPQMASERTEAVFTIRPVSDVLGAEVIGLDLEQPISEVAKQRLLRAYGDNLLLVFREQKLSKAAQCDFSRIFGEFEMPVNADYLGKDFPQLHVVSNLNADGVPTAKKALQNPGNYFWHTDASYMRKPSSSTLLYSVETPSSGGDTTFANMYAAYEALSAEVKQRLGALRAVHSWEQSRLNSGSRPATEEEKRKAPPVSHPLVRTHPETGRKALYLGVHTSHIEGMEIEEGRRLLAELLRHATQDQFLYRHKWQPGDLVMWDNRCLLHKASDDYDMEREARVLHRTVIQGTVPV